MAGIHTCIMCAAYIRSNDGGIKLLLSTLSATKNATQNFMFQIFHFCKILHPNSETYLKIAEKNIDQGKNDVMFCEATPDDNFTR